MKKISFLLLLVVAMMAGGNSIYAQIVGGEMFFPGHYLEIGQTSAGSFGTTTAPAGYYPYPGPNLAEVYDYGHDGWTVGAPATMGDYTFPGSPFEGWGIQVNGTGMLNWGTVNFVGGGIISGTGS